MYLTWHKFFFRDQDDHATLFADPPEAAARQGQSPQGINSAPNSGMARQGELKGSEVFEEPLEQETEADREFALQMFRRRRRRKQMEEGDVSLVTTAGEGETRKVSKRSKAESEDNWDCIVEESEDVHIESARTRTSKSGGKRLKVEDDLKQPSTMRLGSVGTNLMTSERASRCVGVAWTVVKSFTLVVVAPEALTG